MSIHTSTLASPIGSSSSEYSVHTVMCTVSRATAALHLLSGAIIGFKWEHGEGSLARASRTLMLPGAVSITKRNPSNQDHTDFRDGSLNLRLQSPPFVE